MKRWFRGMAWFVAGVAFVIACGAATSSCASVWKQAGFTEGEAAQWRNQGFTPDEAKKWKVQGWTPEDAHGWWNFGFSPEEAKAWKSFGYEPGRGRDANRWRLAGFRASEADTWSTGGYDLEEAKRLKAAGVPPDAGLLVKAGFDKQEAKAWVRAGFSTNEAKAWKGAGFDPEQAKSKKEAGLTPEGARKSSEEDQRGLEKQADEISADESKQGECRSNRVNELQNILSTLKNLAEMHAFGGRGDIVLLSSEFLIEVAKPKGAIYRLKPRLAGEYHLVTFGYSRLSIQLADGRGRTLYNPSGLGDAAFTRVGHYAPLGTPNAFPQISRVLQAKTLEEFTLTVTGNGCFLAAMLYR